jgi:ATP-binding cassette subfamily B protein
MSTVKNADLIVVLSKGEIIEKGKHDELLELKGIYFKLCQLQNVITK